jgi:hypothetical protein
MAMKSYRQSLWWEIGQLSQFWMVSMKRELHNYLERVEEIGEEVGEVEWLEIGELEESELMVAMSLSADGTIKDIDRLRASRLLDYSEFQIQLSMNLYILVGVA